MSTLLALLASNPLTPLEDALRHVLNWLHTAIGLPSYNVAVSVVNTGVSLGAIDNTGAIRVLRVDVAVSLQGTTLVTLSGYRTNYACNPTGTAAQQAECKPL